MIDVHRNVCSVITHPTLHFAALSQAQRRFSQRLVDFKFECIGSRQTDDELVIAGSLKEFGKLIAAIEDEKDRMVGILPQNFQLIMCHGNVEIALIDLDSLIKLVGTH